MYCELKCMIKGSEYTNKYVHNIYKGMKKKKEKKIFAPITCYVFYKIALCILRTKENDSLHILCFFKYLISKLYAHKRIADTKEKVTIF